MTLTIDMDLTSFEMSSATATRTPFTRSTKRAVFSTCTSLKIVRCYNGFSAEQSPYRNVAVPTCSIYSCICGVFHTTDDLSVRKKGQSFFGSTAYGDVNVRNISRMWPVKIPARFLPRASLFQVYHFMSNPVCVSRFRDLFTFDHRLKQT